MSVGLAPKVAWFRKRAAPASVVLSGVVTGIGLQNGRTLRAGDQPKVPANLTRRIVHGVDVDVGFALLDDRDDVRGGERADRVDIPDVAAVRGP